MNRTLLFIISLAAYVVAFSWFAGRATYGDRKLTTARPMIRTSGAMEALNLWAAQRAYPRADIPETGCYDAFVYSRSNLAGGIDASEALQPWQAIGPHNIGGRTLTLAFNPQNPTTIYAGAASGGLWRSYSGGIGALAWEQVLTGFPVLGVSSIAIVPNDSNTIYIGTGEVYNYQNAIGGLAIRTTRGSYGMGILKTTDGGTTWEKVLDWSYNQRRGVWAVRLNPLNPNTVWAATTEGTYKSTDAGATWMQMHTVVMGMDVAINPLDTNIVFAAYGNFGSTGHGIYRTMDGGNTWTKLTAGLPASFGGKPKLAIYQAHPNVLFASIGNGSTSGAGTWLCKSTNNGDSWTIVSTQDYSTYQGWYSHYVGVHPTDSSRVICGGIDIWKSYTGGTNLQQKSYWFLWYFGTPPPGGPEGPPDYAHADHHAIAYHPTNPEIIYFATDGGVFRSTDGGETFEGRNGGYQTTQFYNGFSSAFTDSLLSIGGMQDNATAIYEGTVAWRRVIGGDGTWTAIHSTNPDTMYGAYQNLSIQKSTNRGQTWSGIIPPSSARTSFVAPYVLAPSHPRIMYAGRDKVFKSTTGGGNWVAMNNNQPLDGNPLLSMAISYNSPDTVYAGTAPVISRARIFRTTNGGVSWQDITSNLPDRYPVDLAVDPNNAAIVYVAFSGFGTSHLFKSTNAGADWIDIGGGLPDVPTSAVVVDPDYPNHIYVGNDIGVYVSTDGGNWWEEFRSGMPDATIVMDLSISIMNRKLRAATHGNGVFERSLLSPPASVDEPKPIATGFRLEQNYPNPFNASTSIGFRVDVSGFTSLKVFDLLGREVARLVEEELSPGSYNATWDASAFASGVYLYRLESGGVADTRKLVLLR